MQFDQNFNIHKVQRNFKLTLKKHIFPNFGLRKQKGIKFGISNQMVT